ncbi:hypothetical protein RB195_009058 [Necator americanus]|uniref:Reverse transcriptase domain-containing protein n=1 Tax=Necator americanus TaxID=51031 RepID=A0ABR1CUZ6_NECAM
MPLCLTFIDLKKAFDSIETEAVVEALDNQGVPTQYIKLLRELYKGVRQGDTISPKIFTAILENALRKLEWDDMGVKFDGRQLHPLRFADDIVLMTPSISQAERMLNEFDETFGCIGLQLNLQKTMFMRNGWVSDAPFTLNGTNPNAPVRTSGGCTTSFGKVTGVRQGAVAGPFLFNFAIDDIMRTTVDQCPADIVLAPSGCPLTDLEYADDVVIFKAYGQRLCPDKCKQMWISSRPRTGIRVDGQPIELVNEFCYLGCMLKNNGSYERDVQQRCAKATSAFNSLTKCLCSTSITNEVKLRVYLSAIRPIMMYGSETWAAPSTVMERLDCTERKLLRRLLGYFWPRANPRGETRTAECTQTIEANNDEMSATELISAGAEWHKMKDNGRLPGLVDQIGATYIRDADKANALALHFASVFSSDCNIYKYIKSLKPSVSETYDGIPPIVYKECAATLCCPLAHIFNISMLLGEVPEVQEAP